MTQAEKICANVSADIKSQAVTLANAVLAMQEKIDQQIPIYEQMPLAQQVTVGTGERMLRQNPAVQEFRATVREYAQALNSLRALIGDDGSEVVEDTGAANIIGKSKWRKRA